PHRDPTSRLFPYTTLFRSTTRCSYQRLLEVRDGYVAPGRGQEGAGVVIGQQVEPTDTDRGEAGRDSPQPSPDLDRHPITDHTGRDRKSTRLNSSHVKTSYA